MAIDGDTVAVGAYGDWVAECLREDRAWGDCNSKKGDGEEKDCGACVCEAAATTVL